MKLIESNWITPDQVNLYTRRWQPEGTCRASVVLVHGLGEHCARYDHVASALNQQGIEVSSFDHRGHGRSQGIRGHIPSFEHANQDINHFLEDAGQRNPGLPVFLYGHSMGGCMVLYFVLTRHPHIKGVICTSPGLGTTNPLPASKHALAKVLYRLAPKVTIPNGLDVENLSHDQNVVLAYKADPLNTSQVSARLGLDILNTGAWNVEHASEFDLPLLLMQGCGDYLVSPPATRKFSEGVSKHLITYREWKGLFHELHNEFEKEQVIQVILDWINQQIGV